MKPGVDLACTGLFPHAAAVSKINAASEGSVASPVTTSTSAINGAGLKKCMPSRREGSRSAATIEGTEMDEVLVGRTQYAPTTPSISRNYLLFTSRVSTI